MLPATVNMTLKRDIFALFIWSACFRHWNPSSMCMSSQNSLAVRTLKLNFTVGHTGLFDTLVIMPHHGEL